jgi:RNA binding exosome subunit
MKTVEEVIAFLESEIVRLNNVSGYYGEEIDTLQYYIDAIKKG